MRPAIEDHRTVSELARDLRDGMTQLVRDEFALAKIELTDTARHVARDSVWLIAAAAIGLSAGITFCLFLAAGITTAFYIVLPWFISAWLGPLVATLLLGAAAGACAAVGIRKLRRERYRPEQTEQTLREDQQWLQKRFR
ncbi:MAG: phage holin family protein [Phycisphaeraceae bacterium]